MSKRILYCILAGLFATACTEKTTVTLDDTYTRLVVDGNITTDTSAYSVTLTKTASYFYNEPMPKVTGASVYLDDGDHVLQLAETQPGQSGIYNTDSSFSGKIGKTYSLHIELAQPISGNSSFDATSALRGVTHLDSIATEFHPEWGKEGVWAVKLWAREPGNEINYYLFNLYRNGILLTDTLNKKVISDDKFYNGSYMNGVEVIHLNNAHKWETIYPGDKITLQMSGITLDYYNFINEVRQAGFSIPFFSGPPANVRGNVSNGGVGFFAAYSNSYASTVVK